MPQNMTEKELLTKMHEKNEQLSDLLAEMEKICAYYKSLPRTGIAHCSHTCPVHATICAHIN